MSEQRSSWSRNGMVTAAGMTAALLANCSGNTTPPAETPESVRNTIAGMYQSCELKGVTPMPADNGDYQHRDVYLKLDVDLHVDPDGPRLMEKYKTGSEHSSDVLWPNQFVSLEQYTKDGSGLHKVESPRTYSSADIATTDGPTEIEIFPSKYNRLGTVFVIYVGNTAATGVKYGRAEISSGVPCGAIELGPYHGGRIWGLTDEVPQAEPFTLEPSERLG